MVIAVLLCIGIVAVITIFVRADARDTEPQFYAHKPFDPEVDCTMIRVVHPPYDWETDDDWICLR